MAHRPAQPNPEARFQTQADVEAYVNEVHEMAETPAELRIVTLTSRWANWSQRWGSHPTAANERREELAWRQLRIALVTMDAEDTWLDPRS